MLPYYPALRFKKGEYYAAAKLAADIQRHVRPRFILPPVKEFDPELERVPTVQEIAYLTGDRVGKFWPLRQAFLDTHFVAGDFGDEGLLSLFRTVRARNPNIVAVAWLDDLRNPVFRQLASDRELKLAILLRNGEADKEGVGRALDAAGLRASDCIVFVDFTDASIDPAIAIEAVAGEFERVDEIGLWQRIVFQASNFPIKNPAVPNSMELVPRNEWDVFHAAMKECGVSPDRVAFGDFGPDCATIKFSKKKGGGRAIRHVRYTTSTHTVVARGADEGTDAAAMKAVCKLIVESNHYNGQTFSEADDRLYCIANGIIDRSGNASNWREWNMIHHLTRLVRDLGAVEGLTFSPARATSRPPEQESFFDLSNENTIIDAKN